MNSLQTLLFIMLEILVVDLAFRFNMRIMKSDTPKTAGVMGLLFLSISQLKKACPKKRETIQKLLLSIIAVAFLFIFQCALILTATLNNAVLTLTITLAPIFVMPFFHCLYKLIGIQALSVKSVVFEFRLRAAAALVLGANLVFTYLDPNPAPYLMASHFILSALSFSFLFALGCQQRKKPSTFQDSMNNQYYFIDTEIMYLLSSILEIGYYAVLIYLAYCRNYLEILLNKQSDFLLLFAAFIIIIFTTSTTVKLVLRNNLSRLLDTIESMMIPLSFLIFGISSIMRYYADFS